MNQRRQNMRKGKQLYLLAIIMLTTFLTACGGSGGGDASSGDSSGVTLTGVTEGVAVDPYIVGAVVEEISVDGKLLQSSSGPTNAQGEFIFTDPVSEGSTLRLKASARGMHGNAPYEGMLRRIATADDGNSVVLSPLTTLVANGMSASEVIRMMADADLPGLTEEDIYSDPVAGLEELTSGVTDAMLRNLQANMAANGYMAAIGNFNYNGQPSSGVNLSMSTMVEAVQQTLNANLFNQLATEVGSDFNLGDLIQTAVQINLTIISQVQQELADGGQGLTSTRMEQIVSSSMADAGTIAQEVTQARIGDGGSVTPPDSGTPPTTDPETPVTGEELYVAECQGCHGSLQTTRISNRTANGIQAAIDGVGDMADLILTSAQIQLIADALPAPQPPPVQPPEYRSGQAVYDQECSGCHKLASHDLVGNLDLAGKGGLIVTKIEGGHMGKNLPGQELSALADFADAFTLPEPPIVPRSSQTVYDENCAGCHKLNGYDNVGNIDLAGKGTVAAAKVPAGHGGSVSTDELTNLAAWLDSWAPVPPPVIARDGQAVYDDNCAGCHKLYGYDTVGNIDLASMGSSAATKLGTGHGGTVSNAEVLNLTGWLDSWAPAPPPVVDRNGETIYNENCAVCHKLYGYDAAGNIDLAGRGDTATTKLAGGHGGAVTSSEIANIANWLNTWAPEPPPVIARSGETVYNENCSTCHKLYGYDAVGNIDLASMGNTAIGKLATGHGGAVSDEEVINLADWLDSWSPAAPPVVTRNGETVYNDNCSACHKVNGYDAEGNIDLAGQGDLVPAQLATGHGGAMSADEQTNLVNWLNTFQASDPYAGACDSCHGQPPAGSTFPNTAGSHSVHTALNGLNSNCSACHASAAHNAQVDLDFATVWNAKSGTATGNANGTCSNISCHGGVTTPNWNGGLIDVDTQCSSCHSYGTRQYNSFSSGRHEKHVVDKGFACSTCHDPAKLQNGHFTNLSTRTFEQAPSATIRSSLSYSGGRCATPNCHGGKSW
jgi:predicted CxxxxCH...CXXCH cytochrome family protein